MKKAIFLNIALNVIWCAAVYADNSLALKILGTQPLTKISITGGGEDKTGKFGIGGGLEYNKRITERFVLGAEFAALNRSEHESTTLIPNALTTTSGDTKALLLIAKFLLIPNAKFEPFLAGGLGFSRTQRKMDITPAAGFTWIATNTKEKRTVIDSAESALAWTLRGGFEAALGKGFALGSEASLYGNSRMTHSATPSGREVLGDFKIEGPQTDFVIALYLAYHFTH